VTVRFEHTVHIAAPVEVVFDLSLDIDVHVASMSKSGERAVAGVTRGPIGLGESVTWRARHFGIPFTMTSRVTELDRPRRFVDEQVKGKGPFRRWWHEHVFEGDEGETAMTDRIEFDAPLGLVGRAVEWAVLGRYMLGLIVERGEYLKAEAEPGGPQSRPA
jgi:ligand-binding SRPBCC domain-containing protein